MKKKEGRSVRNERKDTGLNHKAEKQAEVKKVKGRLEVKGDRIRTCSLERKHKATHSETNNKVILVLSIVPVERANCRKEGEINRPI